MLVIQPSYDWYYKRWEYTLSSEKHLKKIKLKNIIIYIMFNNS